MPIIPAPAAPTHELPGSRFTSLATPTRGAATDTAVWFVELDPGTPATPHSLTREEVFVVLEGEASVVLDGEPSSARVGDAILVPAATPFALSNGGDAPLRLVCCFPVGGQAALDDGGPFTPPWAE